jgi:flagellar basal body rod protein FlgG
VNTPGFRPDVPSIRQRQPESIEDGFGFDLSHELLDRLGGGVLAGPQRISTAPGPTEQTGRELDAALVGEDTWFVVAPARQVGEQPFALTRDGSFKVGAAGQLVTAAGEHVVLGDDDAPIAVSPEAAVSIDGAGRVIQDGEVVGRLQVARVADSGNLVKHGQNLLAVTGKQDPREPVADATVRPGFREGSGVDPIKALMQLIQATKAATASGNMIRYADAMMDRAVNTLGRVG